MANPRGEETAYQGNANYSEDWESLSRMTKGRLSRVWLATEEINLRLRSANIT